MIRPDAEQDMATAQPEAASHIILLAEDDDEMRTLLKAYLEMAGYAVTAVPNGVEVIRVICEEGTVPDVLVTDVHMPLMSGLEVLRRLGETEKAPPTIIITSFGDHETHKRARKLGAASVLDKPFDSTTLLGAVKDVLEQP
ncbi:MAG: response regulator [Myxococcota bacterium]